MSRSDEYRPPASVRTSMPGPFGVAAQWLSVVSGRVPSPTHTRLRGINGVVLFLLLALVATWALWVRQPVAVGPFDAPAASTPVERDQGGDDERGAVGGDVGVLRQSRLFEGTRRQRTRSEIPAAQILAQMSKDLELRGILGGDTPRVIIYYRQTQQIHTLSEGQLLGEFEVREIGDMKVIMGWRDEEFELAL